MKRMRIIALILNLTIFLCGIVSADLGEVDEKGGHYDQKTGKYHFHRETVPVIEETTFSIQSQAVAQAELDAAIDVEKDTVWYGAGFFFGVFGVGAAYVLTPSVPPERLLGKSAEYLIYYTNAYRGVVKGKRTEQATVGCIIWGGLVSGYYLYSIGAF